MFQVSLTNLIVVSLVAVLAVVSVLWLAGERGRRRRERERLKHTVLCRICGEVFEDEGGEAIVSCPSCGARNERERIREI